MAEVLLRNRKQAQQVKDFGGLRFGRIYPTDIDAFLDFDDRLFIFMESKFGDAQPGRGQELAYERVCDACEQHGKRKAVVLMLRHDVPVESDMAIDVGACIVTRYRLRGRWRVPKVETTCRQAVDMLRVELDRVLAKEQAATRDVMQGFGIEVDF